MAAKRLTRSESQALTRSRLLDAAGAVFLRRGFEGASLEDISEEAGYTRGALYSNFRDKEELFLAVLERHLNEEVDAAQGIFAEHDSPEARVRALQEWHAAHIDDEEAWASLILEFWLYALRNPAIRPRVAGRQRRVRETIAGMVERQLQDLGVSSPVPARDLASIVLALDSGLAGQRFLDPESVGADVFGSALMLLTVGVANAGIPRSGAAKARRSHAPTRRKSR